MCPPATGAGKRGWLRLRAEVKTGGVVLYAITPYFALHLGTYVVLAPHVSVRPSAERVLITYLTYWQLAAGPLGQRTFDWTGNAPKHPGAELRPE